MISLVYPLVISYKIDYINLYALITVCTYAYFTVYQLHIHVYKYQFNYKVIKYLQIIKRNLHVIWQQF